MKEGCKTCKFNRERNIRQENCLKGYRAVFGFGCDKYQRKMLTDKEIEKIASKYTRLCGGHWEHEEAIPDRDVIDFARDIGKAVLLDEHNEGRDEKAENKQ